MSRFAGFDSLAHPDYIKITFEIEGYFNIVGMPGIEPGLYEPESYVLPVYYIPKRKRFLFIGNYITKKREDKAKKSACYSFLCPRPDLNRQAVEGKGF